MADKKKDASWCQIHTIEGRSPDAVEDISILEYPKKLVVCCDLVKVGPLLICKEQVGFPDGVQHRGVQVQGVVWVLLVCQSWVIPLLP